MKHSVRSPANSPPRDTGHTPAPAPTRDIRRLTATIASGTLTALAVGVPISALMYVGYHLGGLDTMWGTFIGAFFPLTHTIKAWRNRKQP